MLIVESVVSQVWKAGSEEKSFDLSEREDGERMKGSTPWVVICISLAPLT